MARAVASRKVVDAGAAVASASCATATDGTARLTETHVIATIAQSGLRLVTIMFGLGGT